MVHTARDEPWGIPWDRYITTWREKYASLAVFNSVLTNRYKLLIHG